MDSKTQKKWQICLLLASVFAVMLVFFWKVYPVTVIDADDINYIINMRPAVPVPSAWNPIRVLPEVLMPICGYAAGIMAAMGLGSFFECQVFSLAFIISAFISLYIFSFFRLMEKKFNVSRFRAVMYSLLFLLLHFLVFRTEKAGNLFMFHAYDACCYFFYTAGHLLNCSLVMLLVSADRELISFEKPVGSSLLILGIYFAVFSNLYCNITIAVWAALRLLKVIIYAVKNKKAVWAELKKELSPIIIMLLWFASLIIEYSGGRAGSLKGTETGLMSAVGQSFVYLGETLAGFNILFLLMLIGSAAGALLFALLKSDKREREIFFTAAGGIFAGTAIIGVFLVLVSALVYPAYMGRTEVIFPFISGIFVLLIVSAEYILKKIPPLQALLPLLLVLCLSFTETGDRTFIESNAFEINSHTALAIQNDIEQQIISAVDADKDEMTLTLIKTGDDYANWPQSTYTGEALKKIFLKFGLIDRDISIIPNPSEEFNEKYNYTIIKGET